MTSSKQKPIIRKATIADVPAVAAIYRKIHALEKSGVVTIGWDSRTYPIRKTATTALKDNSLFVMTIDGEIVASAIINQQQPSAYHSAKWLFPAPDTKVGVLHTLVVDPAFSRHGLGKTFVLFFETYCKGLGYEVARLDTQVKNTRPFNMYLNMGYRLAATIETAFQTLPAPVNLAIFEKPLRGALAQPEDFL